MSDFFVVWRVICTKTGKNYIVVDEGDDPAFQCSKCYVESNHFPPEKQYMNDERLKRWGHYLELVGRVEYEDLEQIASKDKRGWTPFL